MIVLGIDLSLTSTGLAVVEDGRVIHTTAIKSTGTRADGLTERERRIGDIVNRIRGSVSRHDPELTVLEAPSYGSVHGSAHDRSGLWWATVRMLFNAHVPVATVTPKQRAKYGTGNGNSQKKEVHSYVKLRYGRDDLPIKTDDEGDAVLLAAMGSRHLGFPVETDLDPACLDAMEKVVWPS